MMTSAETIFAQPLVQNLGWALLHSVWQGTLVALLLASAFAALRKSSAGARHAAGVAALVLMLAAPVVTFVYLNASASENLGAAGAQVQSAAVAGSEQLQETGAEEYRRQSHETGGVELSSDASHAPLQEWAERRVEPVLHWLVGLWLAGVLIYSARLFGGWRVAQRLKRQGARPAGAAWEESLARLRRQLGVRRAVALCESVLVEVPTLVGWLKPVVLVPASAFAGLSVEQLEALIAHELAHVRRHDYLVNLLQTFVETLLFYHPAVWWVSRQVRIEREHACDDLAVGATRGGALSYARALASLEQLRTGGRAARTLAVAADGGSLLLRIRRLVGAQRDARPRRFAPLVAACALMAAACAVLACARDDAATARAARAATDASASHSSPSEGRTIAVTFVSVPTFRSTRDSVERLHRTTDKLIGDMSEHKIRAVGFVSGGTLSDSDERVREARMSALRKWLDAGHELGSQSYRHMNLYDTPLDVYKENVVRGEGVLSRLLGERGKKLRYFSYPFLNTGPDAETKRSASEFLKRRGYTTHAVTIDSMEWLFAREHQEALRRGDAEAARRVAEEYAPYMERMMEFYEGLSRDVFGREIPQVLMLTASPVVADQFDETVAMLKRRGYRFVTLEEAMSDAAYSQPETYAGEWGVSWLQRWAHTKLGAMRKEPPLPPYMRRFSDHDGGPKVDEKKGD